MGYMNSYDWEILSSKETDELLEKYEKKFGEEFPSFNHEEFPPDKERSSIEVYLDYLRAAIDADEPFEPPEYEYELDDWLPEDDPSEPLYELYQKYLEDF